MPTYNQAKYLPSALDGIISQTFQNYELIIVNDGSTDNTAEILADYRLKLDYHLIEQENLKLPRALNTGFSHAKGKYLTWTSSDNIMLPEMIER
jgi:glycosyltransferase involved in cell wall biosynthesis